MGSVIYGVGAKLGGNKVKEVWETGKTEKQTTEIHLDHDKDFSLILSNGESHWRNWSNEGTCSDFCSKTVIQTDTFRILSRGCKMKLVNQLENYFSNPGE